ncbi:hypothetical protein BDM02DRAFT_3116609 [Thelephora ganbajun]|uniref:Uncharacterized protein n=1 Tax=Thelephora ganbajun TaxID=370292 RepID=A0ACB6ZEI2_THEGA|nr:hypothetical protein BDM02DRAFT_3116609 [Thelephora ganbajun]
MSKRGYHTCQKCGALHRFDERVQKTGSSNLHPLFGMCCGNRTTQLPTPPPPPGSLRHFFLASTPEAWQFRKNAHQFNVTLSFMSLEAQIDNNGNRGGRFTVNSTSSLLPHRQPPVCAQLREDFTL